MALVPVGLPHLAKPVALGTSHIYSLESRTEREDLCGWKHVLFPEGHEKRNAVCEEALSS